MEIQMRVIKSLLPLCHVSKWVLQSVTNWPSAFIVVLTRKWKLKDLRSLSASNRYLFYGFLQNDRWKEVLLWLLAVHSVAFMFRYREKMTKFEKKSYTVFSNYLVTSTQIGRFKKKRFGLLRISELYWQNLHDNKLFCETSLVALELKFYNIYFSSFLGMKQL